MKDIREYSGELISQIKAGEGDFRHDNLTNTEMPGLRKANALLVKGKNSEMLVCQDRECGHRGDDRQNLQCQVPGLPQEAGAERKGRESDLRLPVRL